MRYNNSMVAHVWAQQNEDAGENGNGCFYFTGSTIFSYNSGFPIAKYVDNGIVLFTTASYSVTTSQHCTLVRRSIPDWVEVFNVPEVAITLGTRHRYTTEQNKKNHKINVQAYREEIAATVLSASRARSNKEWLEARALALVEECNKYIVTFKLRIKELTLPNKEQLVKAAKNAKVNAKRKAAARKKAMIKKAAADVIKWRAGAKIAIPYGLDPMLRIVGDNVETSQHAIFPVSHALKALPLIEACRNNKRGWRPNGKAIALGHFQIDEIDACGNVRAGCHKVRYAEIALLAPLLRGEG